jgi:UDP-glucose 4-epimerase
MMTGAVNVNDVALAHLQAVKVKEAANRRFILNGGMLWGIDIAKALKDEFDPQGYNINVKEMN